MAPRFPASAPLARGGRVTLRLIEQASDRVVYEGVAAAPDRQWPLRVQASVPEGRVTATHGEADGEAAPGWLVELGVALVRGALRASRAGTALPRRLQRWRSGPGEGTEGPEGA